MLPAKTRNFTLTFVCYVFLVFALTDVAQANSHAQVLRRDHSDLNRMIRKRGSVVERDVFAIGAASNPPPASAFGPISSTTSQPPALTLPTSTDSSSITSFQTGLSLGFGSLFNSGSSSSSSSSSSASSSLPPSSSSVPTTSSSSSIPLAASSTSSMSSTVLAATTPSQSTQYETVTNTSAVASNTSNALASNPTSTSHTTITIVIAVAASVGGIAIIWTLIRKWKFRPSSQFGDRMQPIDFQPTHDEHIAGLHRATSNASSFHSNSVQSDENIARPDISHLKPLPDHDFTPGPTHLAPVGGYADLARGPSPGPYRGPSPQPQMQEALHRGPSFTAPSYDQYGVPLHHQGGYGTMNGARY